MQNAASTDHNSMQAEEELVSVIICTRNRKDVVGQAVASVLANRYPNFELIVVDQSTDAATQQLLAPYLEDPRFRYNPTSTKGSGLARAIGISSARGEYVMMTDDDCDVPVDWIDRMLGVFEYAPKIAVVFCDVLPGSHDASKGFITVSIAKRNQLIRNLWEWCKAGGTNTGLGAGMGMRRSLVEKIGNFDKVLGAGTPFFSGEDPDVAIRSLLNGYNVYRTIDTCVQHHGFRTFDDGRKLMRGYMVGTAAMYSKLIKSGHWKVLPVLAFEVWRTVIKPMIVDLLHLRKPPVLGRAIGLSRGVIMAIQTPVDRAHAVFRVRAQ
jgi:glycosyltransferase involved in cell wall biosynthesis